MSLNELARKGCGVVDSGPDNKGMERGRGIDWLGGQGVGRIWKKGTHVIPPHIEEDASFLFSTGDSNWRRGSILLISYPSISPSRIHLRTIWLCWMQSRGIEVIFSSFSGSGPFSGYIYYTCRWIHLLFRILIGFGLINFPKAYFPCGSLCVALGHSFCFLIETVLDRHFYGR